MSQYLQVKDYFKTPDLNLCATLQYKGFKVELIDRQDPSRVVFLIKRENNLDKVVQAYWTRQLQVEPMGFFDTLKQLKSRIHHD